MREMAVNVSISIASLLVSIAVGVGVFAYRAAHNPLKQFVLPIRIEGDSLIEADHDIGFVPRNGCNSNRHDLRSGLQYEIFTDSLGARVNSPGEETQKTVDVITVGGSFAWGHGIENEQTFTALLARDLNIAAANFAFGSYGTVQSVQMLKKNMQLAPSVIIYAFIADHLRRNLAPCAQNYSPYCLPVAFVAFDETDQPYLHPPQTEFFTPDLDLRFYEQFGAHDGIGLKDIWWQLKMDLFGMLHKKSVTYVDTTEKRRAAFRFLMASMHQTADSLNSELIVLYIPRLDQSSLPTMPSIVRDVGREMQISIIDSLHWLDQHLGAGGDSLMLHGDTHPSPVAHALLARQLAPIVSSALAAARLYPSPENVTKEAR